MGARWARSSPRRSRDPWGSSSGSACPKTSSTGSRPLSAALVPQGGAADGMPADFSTTLLARALNLGGAFSDAGVDEPPGLARRRGAGGQRHHQRDLALAPVRRPHRDGRRRAGRADPDHRRRSTRPAACVPSAPTRSSRRSAFRMEQHIGQGFWISSPFAPFGGEGSFGHTGAGGSYGFADPENGLAVGLRHEQDGDRACWSTPGHAGSSASRLRRPSERSRNTSDPRSVVQCRKRGTTDVHAQEPERQDTASYEVTKTEDEWKQKLLARDRYAVLRRAGTEPAWSGELLHVDGDGVFHCAGCGAELFDTDAKFESGTGWPSFDRAKSDGHHCRAHRSQPSDGAHGDRVRPVWRPSGPRVPRRAHRHRAAVLRQLALADLRAGRGRFPRTRPAD